MTGQDLFIYFRNLPAFQEAFPFEPVRKLVELAFVCVPPAMEERLMYVPQEMDTSLSEEKVSSYTLILGQREICELMRDLCEPLGSLLLVHHSTVTTEENEQRIADTLMSFRHLTFPPPAGILPNEEEQQEPDIVTQMAMSEKRWLNEQLTRANVPEDQHERVLKMTIMEAFKAYPRLFFQF